MNADNLIDKKLFLRPGVIFWKERHAEGWQTKILDQVSMRVGSAGKIGYNVLRRLNGKQTGKQIIDQAVGRYTSAMIPSDFVAGQVARFLKRLSRLNFIGSGDLRAQFKQYLSPLFESNRKNFGTDYRPGLLYWEVTNACNLRCLMCYNFSAKPRPCELSVDEGIAAIEQMHGAGTSGIIFTGGEPTIERDKLVHWIQYARQKGIFAELFTNGTLVDKTLARKLKKAGLKYVRVTIHGAQAATHEKISMKKGSFHKALSGMRNLIEAGLPVCWQFTSSKINLLELRLMLEKAIELGCHGFRAGSLDYMGKGIDQQGYMLDPLEELTLWKGLSESIIVHADKIKIGWGADYCKDDAWQYYVRTPQMPSDSAAQDPNAYFRFAKNSLCGIGIRSLGMTSEGDIIPCPTLSEIRLGNIRNGSYQKAWRNSAAFRDLRENMLEDFKGCSSCGVRYSCCGGCRALSYKRFGNLTTQDVRRCRAVARRQVDANKKIHQFYNKKEILAGLSKVELVDSEPNREFHSVLREGLGPWVPNNEVVLYKLNESFIRENW